LCRYVLDLLLGHETLHVVVEANVQALCGHARDVGERDEAGLGVGLGQQLGQVALDERALV